MLKKVISLLLVLCLLGSSMGCGGGNPVVPPGDEDSSEDIIFIQNTNPEDNVLVVAGKDEGEALAVLGEKDAFGTPTKITGAIYTSEQGEALIIDAGDDGLPTYIIDSEGNKVVFTNYTNSTVEISIYNSDNELIEGPTTINVDPADLAELKQLYSTVDSKNKDATDVVVVVLKWGGFGLNWAACALAAFSLVVPAIVYACGSALLSTAAMFTQNDVDNIIVSAIGVLKCIDVHYKPWKILACAGSIMSFISQIIEIINQSSDEDEIKNVINGIVFAMSEQDWNKARSYCVYNSPIYDDICELEEQFYLNEIYYNYFVNIDKIIINYEYAELYGNMTTVQIINSIVIYEKTDTLVCYFQKIDNNWKIYKTIPSYNPTTYFFKTSQMLV